MGAVDIFFLNLSNFILNFEVLKYAQAQVLFYFLTSVFTMLNLAKFGGYAWLCYLWRHCDFAFIYSSQINHLQVSIYYFSPTMGLITMSSHLLSRVAESKALV